jgi:hypothetical protein
VVALHLFTTALKRHGYDFTGFTDSLLALENFKFKYNTYTFVMSDLRRPRVIGIGFIGNIKLWNY